jgi:soluble lytic murein transglycosylase-like protein
MTASYSGLTPEDIERRRKFAAAIRLHGMDTSPVQHWTQALARALQGAMGGYFDYKAGQREKEGMASVMPGLLKSPEYGQTFGADPAQAAPSYDAGKDPAAPQSISPPASPSVASPPTVTMPHSAPRAAPDLLQRVVNQESGGDPTAVSPKGAQGTMQVMPDTARDPGFGVRPARYASGTYDANNPADVAENKRTGQDYLNAMIKRYGGDVEAALVAYNAGPGRADWWMRSGKKANLPAETQDYVKKIMAAGGNPTAPDAQEAAPAMPPEAAPSAPVQVAQNTQPMGIGEATTDIGGSAISPELMKVLSNPWLQQSTVGKAIAEKLISNKLLTPLEKRKLAAEVAKLERGEPLKIGEGEQLLDPNDPSKVLARGGTKQTDDTREYQLYKDQGGTENFDAWDLKRRAAGRQMLTIDQRGEAEYEKTMGKGYADMALETVQGGNKALGTIQKLQVLDALTSGVETGRLAGAQATVGAWAQSLGIDPQSLGLDPKLVITADTLPTIVNSMTIGMIGPGGMPANNFSEADRKFLVAVQPQLYDQPQARAIKTKILTRMEELKIDKANALQDAQEEAEVNGQKFSYQKFENKWRREMQGKSVFSDIIEEYNAMKGGVQKSPAERELDRLKALRSGGQ